MSLRHNIIPAARRYLAIAPDGLRLIGRNERIANAAYRKGAVDWRKARFEAQYTSASLVSVKSWRNAKIEVVANIRDGDGAWPAIWLRSRNVNGFGEIDLMEHLGREPETVHATVHFGTSASDLKVSTASPDDRLDFRARTSRTQQSLVLKLSSITVNGQSMLAMDRQISVGKISRCSSRFSSCSISLSAALGRDRSTPRRCPRR